MSQLGPRVITDATPFDRTTIIWKNILSWSPIRDQMKWTLVHPNINRILKDAVLLKPEYFGLQIDITDKVFLAHRSYEDACRLLLDKNALEKIDPRDLFSITAKYSKLRPFLIRNAEQLQFTEEEREILANGDIRLEAILRQLDPLWRKRLNQEIWELLFEPSDRSNVDDQIIRAEALLPKILSEFTDPDELYTLMNILNSNHALACAFLPQFIQMGYVREDDDFTFTLSGVAARYEFESFALRLVMFIESGNLNYRPLYERRLLLRACGGDTHPSVILYISESEQLLNLANFSRYIGVQVQAFVMLQSWMSYGLDSLVSLVRPFLRNSVKIYTDAQQASGVAPNDMLVDLMLELGERLKPPAAPAPMPYTEPLSLERIRQISLPSFALSALGGAPAPRAEGAMQIDPNAEVTDEQLYDLGPGPSLP